MSEHSTPLSQMSNEQKHAWWQSLSDEWRAYLLKTTNYQTFDDGFF